MKAWTKKKLAEIETGIVSEGSIRIMRQRLSRFESGFTWGHGDITADDAGAICEAIETRKPYVSDAQARKGADWLLKVAFTPRGAVRKTDVAAQFSERDLDVIKALQDAPRFRFIRLEPIYQSGRNVFYLPVYRALTDAGTFDYYAGAWQGATPGLEVCRHA